MKDNGQSRMYLVGYISLILILPLILMVNIGLAKEMRVRMLVGESKVIKLDYDVGKIATGSPDVCDVTRTGIQEILINAIGPGKTNVIIWDEEKMQEEYTITVTLHDASGLARDLQNLLGDIEGVTVRPVGDKVAVEGEVFSKRDLDRVTTVLAGVDNAINMVKMSSLYKEILSSEIQKSIGLKGVKVRSAKDSFLLEGLVSSENERLLAEKIASAYSENIVNVIRVLTKGKETPGISKMIQVTLSVMEIEKEALKGMGFHWNVGSSAGINVGGSATSSSSDGSDQSITAALTGTISNLFPKIQKLNENGQGRALFQQTVVTKDGSKAHFFVGDEIPIPVAQEGGTMSIEYKKVGLTLNISPIIDPHGNIDSSVEVDSSSIIGEGQGGAPKIKDSKISTSVYVKPKDSIILGGLIGQREARSWGGSSPGDGMIAVNDTKRKQLRNTQVLIFITPEILASPKDAVHDLGGKVKDSFKEYEYENIGTEQLEN